MASGPPGSMPGSGRSPGEGHGNSLQYSCLENSMDKGTWQATGHGVTNSDTGEQLTLGALEDERRGYRPSAAL